MARHEGDKLLFCGMSKPEALAIRIEAAKENLPVSQFIRRALNHYLAARGSDVRVLERRPLGKPDKKQRARLRVTRHEVLTESLRQDALSRMAARRTQGDVVR